MFNVVRELRPTYVVVENVAALLDDADAFGWLLGDLAEIGFDAEWSVLSACALGAPHARERMFLVAYPTGQLRTPWMAEKLGELGATLRPAGDGEHAWSRPGVWLEAARCVGGVADGSTARMVAAGGDAVVPQVAEYVGRLVMVADAQMRERVEVAL